MSRYYPLTNAGKKTPFTKGSKKGAPKPITFKKQSKTSKSPIVAGY